LVKLHTEKERRYHVESPRKPSNEYVNYSRGLGIYQINSTFLEPIKEEIKNEKLNELWRMNFDGAYSKAGKWSGIIIISP